MEIRLLTAGSAFDVYAPMRTRAGIEYCPVLEFLENLTEPSRKSILAVIQQHSARGPISNIQKSRPLGDGIFEFKSRQGDRLLFFYSPMERRQIIVTHGFRKGSRLRTEIDRAIRLRAEYMQQFS